MDALEIEGEQRPSPQPVPKELRKWRVVAAIGWVGCLAFMLLYTLDKFSIYRQLTGSSGHELPKMYGKIGEKTIWTFWYHRWNCRTSRSCQLPPFVELCRETIERHKGSFDFKVIHLDEVYDYVSPVELPFAWWRMGSPAQSKDALMNALLARYGGVAMDLTTIMFTDIDDWWAEMISNGAIWRGYRESFGETAVWFMMARREGIFRTAATSQVIEMGDNSWPSQCAETNHYQYLCLGYRLVGNALCMYDVDFCECSRDVYGECSPPNWADTREVAFESLTPSTSTSIMKTDPRLTVVLAKGDDLWCFIDSSNMPLWTRQEKRGMDVFVEFQRRYKERKHEMRFVKLFGSGGTRVKGMGRAEILRERDSLLCYWLCLSGLDQCGVMSGGACPAWDVGGAVGLERPGARA